MPTINDQPPITHDELWMQEALRWAQRALEAGEVPVGAVILFEGRIVGRGWNRNIADCDPTAHAEIVALREAGVTMRNHRLADCDLFVTIEPCAMCAGAMAHARIKRLIYGADDPKAGAVQSAMQVLNHPRLNHRIEVRGGSPQIARQVHAALASLVGRPLVGLDGSAVLQKVDALPTVVSASYDRAFPHTLRITVVPERSAAVLRRGPDSLLVSTHGRVMERLPLTAAPKLPRIWISTRTTVQTGAEVTAAGAATAAQAAGRIAADWPFSDVRLTSTLALLARLRYRVAGPIAFGGIADDARLQRGRR